MTKHNEQFVEPSEVGMVLDSKIALTSSYRALVSDLQVQNQQLTEKLIAVMKENANLKEQLREKVVQPYSDSPYQAHSFDKVQRVSLPNLPNADRQVQVEEDGTRYYFPDTSMNISNETRDGFGYPF